LFRARERIRKETRSEYVACDSKRWGEGEWLREYSKSIAAIWALIYIAFAVYLTLLHEEVLISFLPHSNA
jgi:hypothetical protein